MLAQNSPSHNPHSPSSIEWLLPQVQPHLESLVQSLHTAALEGTAAHEVERSLFHRLLQLGHLLFGSFLKLVGPGDLGQSVTLEDGRTLNRSDEPHTRRLRTVFGLFSLPRWVYAEREGQRVELAPTDQRLQLPQSELSYLLQEWDQLLGVEHAFGRAAETMEAILRLKQSVDTL